MRFYVLALLAALATPAAAEIVSAQYSQPTNRYGHGALGSSHEFERLVIERANGTRRLIDLPDTMVFEDTVPRLADVTGNRVLDVIVVQSDANLGARIAIYDAEGQRIAASPYIGTRFRWLAIAGIADFDGNGSVEIAAVDRPHLARVLRYWAVDGAALREVASYPGVTNHHFGAPEIEGGLRVCGGSARLVLADARWRRILALHWDGKTVSSEDIGPYTGAQSLTNATAC